MKGVKKNQGDVQADIEDRHRAEEDAAWGAAAAGAEKSGFFGQTETRGLLLKGSTKKAHLPKTGR